MIKELGMAAVMSTSLNATDVSLQEFTQTLKANSHYTKSFKYSNKFYLSDEDAKHLIFIAEKLFDVTNKQLELFEHKIVFRLDNWFITETKDTIDLMESLISSTSIQLKAFRKFSKDNSNHKKLAKIEHEIALLLQKQYDLAIVYRPRIDQAKETMKFMESFIPQNEEVLKALA